MSDETIDVRRNDAEDRYEILVDGSVAGFTQFVERNGAYLFPHTEIDPAYGGRGLGGALVGAAMTDMAERGDTVVPLCPFVVKYLKTHDVAGLDISWPPSHA